MLSALGAGDLCSNHSSPIFFKNRLKLFIYYAKKYLMASSSRKTHRSSSKANELMKKPSPPPEKFKNNSDRYSFSHLANVLTSGDRIAMLKAVDRLQGKARILVELACFSNFQYVRLAAISHLTFNEDALVEIAKYCQFADTRAAAVDELSMNNSKGLIEVACSSLFKETRVDAVSVLEDPNALSEIASHSPNKDSRDAAIEKISEDNESLAKIAMESKYKAIRDKALKKLKSDPEALSLLLISSKHSDVKKKAASELTGFVDSVNDIDALIEIAKLSPNEDARYLAVGRLSEHPWALKSIIHDSKYRDAKSTALMLLSDIVYEIEDPEMLSEVAILSPYEDCRAVAVGRLVGKSSALLDVASKAKFKDSRELALDQLKSDTETLKSVSKLSKYQDTRKRAHALVSHPDNFKEQLQRILG